MRVSTATLARLARLEAERDAHAGRSTKSDVDPEVYDWYAPGCPCGLPPGECREHPRARPSQRLPADRDWRTFAYVAGRGAGKTRAAVSWVNDRVRRGIARNILLIAAATADVRDVLVEGLSGFLATSPPGMAEDEPSKRRLTWPNGARATCLSGEEPERARGHNVDTLLCDELPAWQYPGATWRLARLALRMGDARAFVATTPRTEETLVSILEDPTTVASRESTLTNARHLAPEFITQVTEAYRLSRNSGYS